MWRGKFSTSGGTYAYVALHQDQEYFMSGQAQPCIVDALHIDKLGGFSALMHILVLLKSSSFLALLEFSPSSMSANCMEGNQLPCSHPSHSNKTKSPAIIERDQ
jgi:hypothetical protein